MPHPKLCWKNFRSSLPRQKKSQSALRYASKWLDVIEKGMRNIQNNNNKRTFFFIFFFNKNLLRFTERILLVEFYLDFPWCAHLLLFLEWIRLFSSFSIIKQYNGARSQKTSTSYYYYVLLLEHKHVKTLSSNQQLLGLKWTGFVQIKSRVKVEKTRLSVKRPVNRMATDSIRTSICVC